MRLELCNPGLDFPKAEQQGNKGDYKGKKGKKQDVTKNLHKNKLADIAKYDILLKANRFPQN